MRFISYHVQINYTCINEQLEVSPFAPQGEGSAAWAVALKLLDVIFCDKSHVQSMIIEDTLALVANLNEAASSGRLYTLHTYLL